MVVAHGDGSCAKKMCWELKRHRYSITQRCPTKYRASWRRKLISSDTSPLWTSQLLNFSMNSMNFLRLLYTLFISLYLSLFVQSVSEHFCSSRRISGNWERWHCGILRHMVQFQQVVCMSPYGVFKTKEAEEVEEVSGLSHSLGGDAESLSQCLLPISPFPDSGSSSGLGSFRAVDCTSEAWGVRHY